MVDPNYSTLKPNILVHTSVARITATKLQCQLDLHTVEALLSHTPPSHEKCMGYEGLWEDRERLHARLAGISVPNVMKGIKVKVSGRAWECHNLPGNVILTEFDAFYADQGLLNLAVA